LQTAGTYCDPPGSARNFRSFVKTMAATDPETLLTLADYERVAAAAMEPAAHAYVAGGAGDEITQRDNERAWARWAVRPRMLVGVGRRDPGVELLGRRRPHPLL